MEQCHVIKDLVAIVPSIEGAVTRVVVQHGDMRVLILEGNVYVLVGRGVGGVGVVHLSTSRVAIGNVKCATDHKRLAGTPLWVAGCPAFDDLKGVGVQLADHNVASIFVGGVDGPQPPLVHHEVNVRMTTPGVVVGIVEAGVIELPGLADGGGAEVKLDDDVALEFIKVDGAVVDHLTCS